MQFELSNGKDRVFQWDHDITLTILEPENVPEVHFRWGNRAVPCPVENQQVAIPPELMQLPQNIVLWAYTPDHTMDMAKIKLEQRPKPADYAYTPTEIRTWEQLDERITVLEDGGGVAGVSSVNGETGDVEITAKGLGALTEDDLQSATDKALAQAKASGEFDGAQGPKGDPGKQGPQGPAGAGLDVTGATVGQIVKISAVDDSGVPTAWSPVDMPSGGSGGETWEKVAEMQIDEDVNTASVTFHPCTKIHIFGKTSGEDGKFSIVVNAKDDQYSARGSRAFESSFSGNTKYTFFDVLVDASMLDRPTGVYAVSNSSSRADNEANVQWYGNGNVITKYFSEYYNIDAVPIADSGIYKVTIANVTASIDVKAGTKITVYGVKK